MPKETSFHEIYQVEILHLILAFNKNLALFLQKNWISYFL